VEKLIVKPKKKLSNKKRAEEAVDSLICALGRACLNVQSLQKSLSKKKFVEVNLAQLRDSLKDVEKSEQSMRRALSKLIRKT
jgi:hypothetical protein